LSPSRSRAAALILAAAGLFPGTAAGEAAFDVSGAFEPAPAGLIVRVGLRNVGTETAEDVRLHGELLGSHAEVNVSGALAPGATHDARLEFPEAAAVPGVHALVLRIEFERIEGASDLAALGQWAYLLVAFGGPAAAAVQIEVPPSEVADTTVLPVKVRSADGRAHRVRLSLYVPEGLAAVPHRQTLDVPASGEVAARVRLIRSSARAGTRSGLLAVAVTEGEALVHTTVATGVTRAAADPALLPRMRGVLVGAAAALLAYAVRAQWRRRDLARRARTV
jgi:hypothetical protein